MRLLFTTTAGLGHFHPLVPLAHAAVRAGHTVAFACPQALCPTVVASGFAAFPMLDLDDHAAERRAAMDRIRRLPSDQADIAMVADMFIGIYARAALPALVTLCRRWQPDLIVREEGEFAGPVAAEHLELPHATVQVVYASAMQAAIVGNRLDALRATWGLPPDPGLARLTGALTFSFDPPSLRAPDHTDPPTTHHLRTEVFDQSGRETLPSWVAQQRSRPLIYITLGSEAPNSPSIFPTVYQALLAGVRELGGTVVMTIGRERDPAVFDPQPEHIHIERYVPQSQLLPQCDLVVSHGGHNTVLAALQHGLPQVLVPLFADQFHNAARCAALEVGVQIAREELRPVLVRDTVQRVLADARYRRNARRVQTEMEALPSVEHGVELLERVVAEHAASVGRV